MIWMFCASGKCCYICVWDKNSAFSVQVISLVIYIVCFQGHWSKHCKIRWTRHQNKEIPPKNRISYQLLYPSITHVLFSAFRFTALPPAANFGTEIPNSAWVTRATMVSVCTASWSFCCTVSVDNLYCRYIMLSLLKHSLYLQFLTFDVCGFFLFFFGYETTRSSSAGNCFAASSKS